MSKDKGTPKKERKYPVTIRYPHPIKATAVRIDGNEITLISENGEETPEYVTSEIILCSDRKDKPEKKIMCAEISRPCMYGSNILEGYSILIALDTNYKYGRAVAFGIAYLITSRNGNYELFHLVNLVNDFQYVGFVSPELIALDSLIKEIRAGNNIHVRANDKILIVIDHHLGEIEHYNNRSIPLISEDKTSFVPDNVKLMYASADKKNDSIFNEMIAECDKYATKIFRGELE